MIDVGEGHNTLNYTNSSAAQKMDIVGGSGEDDMNFIADYGADNWTVKAGNGDNVIRALGMIVGNVASFSTGVGSDNVQLKSSWLGTLEVYTGDGDDRVALAFTSLEHVFVELGKGSDGFFALGNYFYFYGVVDGDEGFDAISLLGNIGIRPDTPNLEILS